MKKNNQNSTKKTLKKQLISGGVYIALSAVAVAVTVNTAVSIMSKNNNLPGIDEASGNDSNKMQLNLPSVPENIVMPNVDIPFSAEIPSDDNVSVSESPSGISAEIFDETQDSSLLTGDTFTLTENQPDELSQYDVKEIASNTNLGQDTFIKPCDGFVTVEHSVDIPVYSSTFGDYRTHCGIDIAADKGAVVSAVKGGVITKIYTDDLYGHTLHLETPDGYTFVYSNLSMPLSQGIEEGLAVSTGTILASVGDSAICESAQESHLHFEVQKDDCYINPLDIIVF